MCKKPKPCKECPFSRTNVLSDEQALGGSRPEVYIGQAEGPFWLPCHMDPNYKGKETSANEVLQCRGAAIYRANLGISERMPRQVLRLEKNTDLVFSNHVEFLMKYRNMTKENAQAYLTIFPPIVFLKKELNDAGVKKVELV